MRNLEWTQTAKNDLYAIMEFIAEDTSGAQRISELAEHL